MLATILIVVALVLAAVDEIRAQGQALTSWGVIALSVALLVGRL